MQIESGHVGSTFTTLELKVVLGFWGFCSPVDWRMDGKGGITFWPMRSASLDAQHQGCHEMCRSQAFSAPVLKV